MISFTVENVKEENFMWKVKQKKSNCNLTGVVDKHIRGVLYEQQKKLMRKDLYLYNQRHKLLHAKNYHLNTNNKAQ